MTDHAKAKELVRILRMLEERELTPAERESVKKLAEKMKDGSAKAALKKKFGKDWVSAAFGIATNIVKKRSARGNDPNEPLGDS